MVKRKRATKKRKRKKLTFEQEMDQARAFERKRHEILQKYYKAEEGASRARTKATVVKRLREAAKYEHQLTRHERRRPELAKVKMYRIGAGVHHQHYTKAAKYLLKRIEEKEKKRKK